MEKQGILFFGAVRVVNGGYLGGGVNLGAFRKTEKDISVMR